MFKGLRKHIHYKKEYDTWQARYDTLASKAGEMSPDFELFDVSGTRRVRLSECQGQRPVALIFGSFT